jgi:hypothetical protein
VSIHIAALSTAGSAGFSPDVYQLMPPIAASMTTAGITRRITRRNLVFSFRGISINSPFSIFDYRLLIGGSAHPRALIINRGQKPASLSGQSKINNRKS